MNRIFDIIGPRKTENDIVGPRKTEKTFAQKLIDSFTFFRSAVPLGSSPTSRLFARVPPSTFIILVGLDGCGKSTLLRKYLAPQPESVQTINATPGIRLEELQVGPAFYQAADIGGCRPAISIRFDEELFKRADAVIYIVDAADRDRVMEAREEFIMCGLRANNGGMRQNVPLLVLATKIDLKDARRPDQIETYFIDNISTSIGDRPTKVAGANLLSGEGVLDALSWLSNELLNKSFLERRMDTDKAESTEKTVSAEKAGLNEKSRDV